MRNLIRNIALAAALFMPMASIAAYRNGGESAAGARLAQMCDEGSRDVAGLPTDQYKRVIQAGDAQRAALDDLANATLKAAQNIKAACPTEAALTAPGRLAAMQTRIETMIAAVATVRPPLEKFYGLLSDEQRERIIALGRNQRQSRTGSLLEQDCGSAQSSASEWPTTNIERTVHPTEAQRASLMTLQDAAAKAADISKNSCPTDSLLTPTARIAAVGKRLDALLQAVKTVIAPLNDFYGILDDEQKARFNGISLTQTSQIDQPKPKPSVVHRYHFMSLGYFIRHLFSRF
jgi:LTXXQ motif family protein